MTRAKRRRVRLTGRAPEKGAVKLWAYGFEDYGDLFGVSAESARRMTHWSDGGETPPQYDPGDLESICRLWAKRHGFDPENAACFRDEEGRENPESLSEPEPEPSGSRTHDQDWLTALTMTRALVKLGRVTRRPCQDCGGEDAATPDGGTTWLCEGCCTRSNGDALDIGSER